MLNITDKKLEEKIPAWLRLGFRPFFLFGSIYAIVAIALWVWMFQSGQPNVLAVPALWWHVHEMLFGFSMAIVVGFVLTAVQNWTGINGTKHYTLLVLFGLWLAPRILLWTSAPLWWRAHRRLGSRSRRSFDSRPPWWPFLRSGNCDIALQ